MIRALFTAASGMIVQERNQSVVANNLANSSTISFKQQAIMAKEVQKKGILNIDGESLSTQKEKEIGEMSFGVEIDRVFIDFQQGELEETGKDTDIALLGEGFFKVQTDNTEVGYSRNGKLRVDKSGFLTNQEGYALLGTDLSTYGESLIKIGDKDFNIDKDGTISIDGKDTYKLKIVNLGNVDSINPQGKSIYKVDNAIEYAIEDVEVIQGSLEKSNVNPLEQMVKMIEITRSFESNQKVIQAADTMLGKAVNEVGKLR